MNGKGLWLPLPGCPFSLRGTQPSPTPEASEWDLVFPSQCDSGVLVKSDFELTTLSSVGVTAVSQNPGRGSRTAVQPYASGLTALGLPAFPPGPSPHTVSLHICPRPPASVCREPLSCHHGSFPKWMHSSSATCQAFALNRTGLAGCPQVPLVL